MNQNQKSKCKLIFTKGKTYPHEMQVPYPHENALMGASYSSCHPDVKKLDHYIHDAMQMLLRHRAKNV